MPRQAIAFPVVLVTRAPLKRRVPFAPESVCSVRHRCTPSSISYRIGGHGTESSTPTSTLDDIAGRVTASRIKESPREKRRRSPGGIGKEGVLGT